MDKVNLLVNKYNFIEADEMFVQLGLTGQFIPATATGISGSRQLSSYKVIETPPPLKVMGC